MSNVEFSNFESELETAHRKLASAREARIDVGERMRIRCLLHALPDGIVKYQYLCYRIARSYSHLWVIEDASDVFEAVPIRMMSLCKDVILGRQPREQLRDMYWDIEFYTDDAHSYFVRNDARRSGRFFPFMARTAAQEGLALFDASIFTSNDRDIDLEPILLDTPAYAEMEFSNPLWEPEREPGCRSVFWSKWLDDVWAVSGVSFEAIHRELLSDSW